MTPTPEILKLYHDLAAEIITLEVECAERCRKAIETTDAKIDSVRHQAKVND
jgi:hypothetical protein